MDNSLSLKQILTRYEKIRAQAEQVWVEIAEQLEVLIPEDLTRFATERGWLEDVVTVPTRQHWNLSRFLKQLAEDAKIGGYEEMHFYAADVVTNGFRSIDDLQTKLLMLGDAWHGIVRIEFDEDDLPDMISVLFYAA